ncbi:Oligopeptide/dipeptide transporter, C-terminal region [Proteiniborus ethanoligenes]|uniref:Oligopeptide/dipeptide transporter, C-terminal region n=1 Tax=Proteiniborus ethanoligenes TaxID=415015 RepID=A0A1H3PT18_9FIRM|nr:dipeptide ABC transporter ATP-binding protein [Proteiniborus ethanoligenes]SDZ04081.1 Oligopeptide/dipeptide transporter, C-terminal region [Proteiniborus ethanoligenes]
MRPLLEVKNLKKYFDVPNGHLHAVDNVSLQIKEGETLGIVGESGCGKSTLGRVILRLHEPTSGSIIYDGMDITTFNKEEMRQMRKNMQIIFQDPYASLNPRYTISQIIEEPLRLHNIYKNDKERKERVESLMEYVGLSKRAYNLYPHEFDGGRRQRVVIARALAIDPKFIVCDEPVSALDVSVQAQILNLMMELQNEFGLTYIFISHDLSVVKHISNDIGVMYLGQLIEKAPKKDIFKQPLHPYTIALLSAIPSTNIKVKKKKIILKGEIVSPINPKPGCRFSVRCPFATEQCVQEDPQFIEVEEEHFVACFRYEEIKAGALHFETK